MYTPTRYVFSFSPEEDDEDEEQEQERSALIADTPEGQAILTTIKSWNQPLHPSFIDSCTQTDTVMSALIELKRLGLLTPDYALSLYHLSWNDGLAMEEFKRRIAGLAQCQQSNHAVYYLDHIYQVNAGYNKSGYTKDRLWTQRAESLPILEGASLLTDEYVAACFAALNPASLAKLLVFLKSSHYLTPSIFGKLLNGQQTVMVNDINALSALAQKQLLSEPVILQLLGHDSRHSLMRLIVLLGDNNILSKALFEQLLCCIPRNLHPIPWFFEHLSKKTLLTSANASAALSLVINQAVNKHGIDVWSDYNVKLSYWNLLTQSNFERSLSFSVTELEALKTVIYELLWNQSRDLSFTQVMLDKLIDRLQQNKPMTSAHQQIAKITCALAHAHMLTTQHLMNIIDHMDILIYGGVSFEGVEKFNSEQWQDIINVCENQDMDNLQKIQHIQQKIEAIKSGEVSFSGGDCDDDYEDAMDCEERPRSPRP